MITRCDKHLPDSVFKFGLIVVFYLINFSILFWFGLFLQKYGKICYDQS